MLLIQYHVRAGNSEVCLREPVCVLTYFSLFAYNYITSSQQSSVIYYNYSLYMTL